MRRSFKPGDLRSRLAPAFLSRDYYCRCGRPMALTGCGEPIHLTHDLVDVIDHDADLDHPAEFSDDTPAPPGGGHELPRDR